MVVIGTDLPGANGLDISGQSNSNPHYSKTQVAEGIYGVNGVYVDDIRANEELRILVAQIHD